MSIRTRYTDLGIGPNKLNRNRDCVICSRPAFGLGEMCALHRLHKRSHGHPKVARGLLLKEWRPILPSVLRYMKVNPPSAQVLASVGRLTEPGNAPPPSLSKNHPRRLLYEELVWWTRPEARKARSAGRWKYTPRPILTRLVAAQVVIEEQERRFPGAAPEIELAHTIAMMFRRRRTSSGRRGKRISGSVLRGLADRIRSSGAAGVYILQSARGVIRHCEREQREIAIRPKNSQPPPPRVVEGSALKW